MTINNALASVAVKDISTATQWWEKFFDRQADSRPMPGLAEWHCSADGHRVRNTEILTVRGAKITEVQAYFGWDLPHKAAVGGFVTYTN